MQLFSKLITNKEGTAINAGFSEEQSVIVAMDNSHYS